MRFEHLTTVSEIDRAIDRNHAELRRRSPHARRIAIAHTSRTSLACGLYQKAWDANPDLFARSSALYSRRYDAQQCRDTLAYEQAQRLERAEKRATAARYRNERAPSKCPTCGFHTLTVVTA